MQWRRGAASAAKRRERGGRALSASNPPYRSLLVFCAAPAALASWSKLLAPPIRPPHKRQTEPPNGVSPEQLHRANEPGAKNVEGPRSPRPARRAQAVGEGASDQDRACAEAKGLHHVAASANATID